jgi:hypothetical protein
MAIQASGWSGDTSLDGQLQQQQYQHQQATLGTLLSEAVYIISISDMMTFLATSP